MLPLHHYPGTDPSRAFQSSCGHYETPYLDFQWPEVESNHRCRRIRATCFRYNTGPQIGEAGIEPADTCARGTWATITLHPTFQIPHSNSSSGSRTPSSALKGQCPGPVDERAMFANDQRRVGQVALESTSPGFQPSAIPSQLPTRVLFAMFCLTCSAQKGHEKSPASFCDTGRF